MKNSQFSVLVILFLFLASCSGVKHDHSKHGEDETVQNSTDKESVEKLYTCPMHPQIVQEKPGTCPICGMDLVEKKSAKTLSDNSKHLSTITIDPVTVQNMGIRVARAEKGVVLQEIRSYGRVVVSDDRIRVVNLRYSGWVEKIWVDKIGESVKKGEKLFAIYSPEIYSAEKEFVMALKNYGEESSIALSAKERLKLWGVPLWTINRVAKNKKAERLTVVFAPSSGFIQYATLLKGSHVNSGKDLYAIYTIDKVWVKSEIYDFDAAWVSVGDTVQLRLSASDTMERGGTVDYIYPTLNDKTRTITIRIELNNKDRALKPGMLATVVINSGKDNKRVVVPTESIIDTGNKKVVFISKKGGQYESRKVKTGLSGDNGLTEIIDGISEGETVVLSGQFLLDSESQMQEAVAKFLHTNLQKHH